MCLQISVLFIDIIIYFSNMTTKAPSSDLLVFLLIAAAAIAYIIDRVNVFNTGEAVDLIGRLLADPVGFALDSPEKVLDTPCIVVVAIAPALFFGFAALFFRLVIVLGGLLVAMAYCGLIFGMAVVWLLIMSFVWITDLAQKMLCSC
jgi:hypothetical protein